MRLHPLNILLAVCCFLASLLAVVSPGDRRDGPDAEPGESGAWGAFEWWYAQRSQPFDLIPAQGFQRAAAYARTAFRKERHLPGVSTSESGWRSLGPVNIGGRVLSIAVDPTDRNTVWVGTASGGLWKSLSAGIGLNAWQPVPTGFPTLSVSAVAVDPLHHNTVYIGTGEISLYQRPLIGTPGARASYGMGVLKTTDGGATWSQTPLTWTFSQITAVQRLIINPVNPSTIYAATSEGTYRSRDAGATWAQIHSVPMAMDLVVNPADTTRLFVACGSLNSSPNAGLYFSQDAGSSWSQMTIGLPLSNVGRTGLAISSRNPSVLYAGIANATSSATLGIYKTTNAGGSWSLASSVNYVGSQGWYNNVVALRPGTTDTLYCAGLNVHRSMDGAATLPSVSTTGVHVDQHAIAFDPVDPAVMYFGNDGGIFKSTNGGTTFMNINNNFTTTQLYPGFAASETDTNLFIAGLQDNGTIKHTGNGYWTQIFGGDGGWCAIDPLHNNLLYFEFQYLQIYKSVNTGVSAAPIMSGLPIGASNANFIPPFVMAPSSPNILYAGNKNVYKTTNGGLLWFAPNGGANLNGTNVACIGVSKTSPDTLLAATGSGALGVSSTFEVFASTNGGTSWTSVNAGLPNRYPTDLEFDPTDGATVYLTYSGYGTPHLFRSTDVGQTWTNLSANLPDIPHQSIVVDPEYPDHLFVGNDLGVYRSTDNGASWEDFSAGMPPAMILDLTITRSNSALRASTFGSGLYQRTLHRTPLLTLTSPAGGEKYISGEARTITWSQKFLDAVRIEFSSDRGATWNLVADDVPASPPIYDWTVPNITTSHALVRIIDAVNDEASDSSDGEFGIYFNPDVAEGWNLVSIEHLVPDPRTASVFPTATSAAFRYQTGYLEDDSLDHGVGYWLKFAEPQFTDLFGDSLHSDTIDVRPGWNMVGSVAQIVPVSEILQTPADNIASLYFGFRSGYLAADSLLPKRGYWVKAKAAGRIVLPYIPELPQPLKTSPAAPTGLLAIEVRDAAGGAATLYVARTCTEALLSAYELPPAPPAPVLDARWSNGAQLAPVESEAAPAEITLGNAVYPVTLRWRPAPGVPAGGLLVGGTRRAELSGEGSIVLAHPTSVRLLAGQGVSGAIPDRFELLANYPNPFNPSTTIRYALPARTHVLVRIFDLLGREVARLDEGPEEPGIRTLRWDAAGFPSGIYFCTVEAGAERATQKLVLLK
jgi:photosystem II stability/assembly factor-like uncharacterized protein